MEQLFKDFLNIFRHPFHTHRDYLAQRRGAQFFQVRPSKLSLVEGICLAWVFVFVKGIIALFFIELGQTATYLAAIEQSSWINSIFEVKRETLKWLVLSTVWAPLWFPVTTFIFLKIGKQILGFFCTLYGKEDVPEEAREQIMVNSLSSYILEPIPIVGGFFRTISQMIQLFAGCRDNLGFTTAQSLLAIASPIIILASLLFLFVSFLGLFFSSFWI